jgi:signal peptidase I
MIALVVACAALLALAAAVLVVRRRLTIVSVFGPSMRPCLRTGDRVLARRAAIGRLRVGQIVVIERPAAGRVSTNRPPGWPPDGREWLIKRVAAVPGDAVPSWVPDEAVGRVPDGWFAVLGDNVANSLDSRRFGLVPAHCLLGVMVRPVAVQRAQPPVTALARRTEHQGAAPPGLP